MMILKINIYKCYLLENINMQNVLKVALLLENLDFLRRNQLVFLIINKGVHILHTGRKKLLAKSLIGLKIMKHDLIVLSDRNEIVIMYIIGHILCLSMIRKNILNIYYTFYFYHPMISYFAT